MDKRCSKCGETKPLSEFFQDRRRRDGLTSSCKVCCMVATRTSRQKNKQHYVQFNREYNEKNKSRISAYRKEYNESNKDKLVELERRYRSRYTARMRANFRVQSAVRHGRLTNVRSLACVECGQQAENYHHHDYNKPLEVVPMCDRCHGRWHSKNKPIDVVSESQ